MESEKEKQIIKEEFGEEEEFYEPEPIQSSKRIFNLFDIVIR